LQSALADFELEAGSNLELSKPPCAGITLIRFYGFDLSLKPSLKHPGKLKLTLQNYGRFFRNHVTFLSLFRFIKKPVYEKYFFGRRFF
jgi:hypothetical protein